MASKDIISNLMKQYGGNPADADYWTGQYESQGTDFLSSPSFKSMTGRTVDDSALSLVKTLGVGNSGSDGGGGSGASDQTIDFSGSGLKNNDSYQAIMDQLKNLTPAYDKAVTDYQGIEKLLDDYEKRALGSSRTSFDDIWKTINQAANVSAGRGLGSGTEQKALQSSMLSDLAKREEEKKAGIMRDVTGLKTTVRAAAPGTMGQILTTLNSMYGTEAKDNLNWAQIIANMVQSGYTG